MSLFRRIKNKIQYIVLSRKPEQRLEKIIAEKKGIVFLMYHSTPKENSNYGYITHEESFKQQMFFLRKKFEVISVGMAEDILYGNKPRLNDKPMAVITFDDGFQDNFDIAYPILKQHKMPFTIFLTTRFIENDNHTFMSWQDVNILNNDPLVTLGAHSNSHANLMSLAAQDKEPEIKGSKDIIESKINNEVKYFAYPSGGYDKKCLDLVENNYCLGFKDRTNNQNDKDKRKVARVSIDSRHNIYKNFIVELALTQFLS